MGTVGKPLLGLSTVPTALREVTGSALPCVLTLDFNTVAVRKGCVERRLLNTTLLDNGSRLCRFPSGYCPQARAPPKSWQLRAIHRCLCTVILTSSHAGTDTGADAVGAGSDGDCLSQFGQGGRDTVQPALDVLH